MKEEAAPYADAVLREISQGGFPESVVMELGELFLEMDRWDEFERVLDRNYPGHVLEMLRDRLGVRPRRR
jgi:hypothetical protein